MFVRKKKNRSGSISIVVVNKSHGQFKVVKHFGVVQTESEAEHVYQAAQQWISTYAGQAELDLEDRKGRELEETKRVVGNMDAVLINGTQLLLEGIYDDIGFNRIADEILRHLVIGRVSQPARNLPPQRISNLIMTKILT